VQSADRIVVKQLVSNLPAMSLNDTVSAAVFSKAKCYSDGY
jgi:hypothetical protein